MPDSAAPLQTRGNFSHTARTDSTHTSFPKLGLEAPAWVLRAREAGAIPPSRKGETRP